MKPPRDVFPFGSGGEAEEVWTSRKVALRDPRGGGFGDVGRHWLSPYVVFRSVHVIALRQCAPRLLSCPFFVLLCFFKVKKLQATSYCILQLFP